MRYFEDFAAGDVHDLGSVTVTAEEIIEFGERYDPQPFHTDPAAAADSAFGGLVASGWLTASLFMRAYVDGLLRDSACAGSPGVDEIRYRRPVCPGDTLGARLTVLRTGPVLGHKDRGLVQPRCELLDDAGQQVFSMTLHSLFLRRPAATGS
ncbi:MaoC family dehydratase [Streptomyces sp. SPB162]|uniref:MaoC family dehydratase n=1 Tax=Streptomyces sp. SPB162 TaxID=2940560 RepID=UPI00240725D1|nr:MaoC family dehydratase [Streptomyces sp. SPB162]MDF9817140.1 acyl dehydratase [Streptomyces sp. SPB162]